MLPTYVKNLLCDVFVVLGTIIVILYATPATVAVLVPLVVMFFIIKVINRY